MNWFKLVECWFNKKHVLCNFYTGEGKLVRKCIRCGVEK